MKSILRFLADLALLPVTGCIFPDNRDNSEAPANPPAAGDRPDRPGRAQPCPRIILADQIHLTP